MTSTPLFHAHNWTLSGQADRPPSIFFGAAEVDFWPYRTRTVALLRRYGRASVEVGRLPSVLGREFFRARVTSYSIRNFEDVMIFVTDMERTIERLNSLDKKLVTMNVLEEYSVHEMSRLLCCSHRSMERKLQDAIDQLSRLLLIDGLLDRLPDVRTRH